MININIQTDKIEDEEREQREEIKEREDKEDVSKSPNLPIYRFKFTKDFMEELYTFSKIHQYDERNDFKEAWKVWTEDNEEIINNEIKYDF